MRETIRRALVRGQWGGLLELVGESPSQPHLFLSSVTGRGRGKDPSLRFSFRCTVVGRGGTTGSPTRNLNCGGYTAAVYREESGSESTSQVREEQDGAPREIVGFSSSPPPPLCAPPLSPRSSALFDSPRFAVVFPADFVDHLLAVSLLFCFFFFFFAHSSAFCSVLLELVGVSFGCDDAFVRGVCHPPRPRREVEENREVLLPFKTVVLRGSGRNRLYFSHTFRRSSLVGLYLPHTHPLISPRASRRHNWWHTIVYMVLKVRSFTLLLCSPLFRSFDGDAEFFCGFLAKTVHRKSQGAIISCEGLFSAFFVSGIQRTV